MARSDTHTAAAGCADDSDTGLSAGPAAGGRAFAPAGVGRRLLLVPAALLVLRGTEAALAVATVGLLRLIPVDQAAAHLHVSGLAKIEADPHTATTALVTLALSATLAAVLLRSRSTLAQFAAIKVFALVAATAITGVYAPGPLRVQIAVAVTGVGTVVLLWSRMRVAVPRVLETVNIRHVDGRAADILLAVKISALVAVIVLLG
ncbi:histidine kinase [Frankia gtarii]|uniref:histidine kinase n=1 Tax=Frankia gtarii TaxID=2950102 RepID=UPI0021BE1FA0|nr:histidine kinase [Frankia gtarii]